MYNQEIEIREQVVNSYEDLMNRRQIEYQRKLEQTKESIKHPYEVRVSI